MYNNSTAIVLQLAFFFLFSKSACNKNQKKNNYYSESHCYFMFHVCLSSIHCLCAPFNNLTRFTSVGIKYNFLFTITKLFWL